MNIDIENYCQQPAEAKEVAHFDIYLPDYKMRMRRFKLLRSKKGGYFIRWPSYTPHHDLEEKAWFQYVEFGKEQNDDIVTSALHELKKFGDIR